MTHTRLRSLLAGFDDDLAIYQSLQTPEGWCTDDPIVEIDFAYHKWMVLISTSPLHLKHSDLKVFTVGDLKKRLDKIGGEHPVFQHMPSLDAWTFTGEVTDLALDHGATKLYLLCNHE